jgi:hypothetical protein
MYIKTEDVNKTSGTEGPKEDPYAFNEFTVECLKEDGTKDVFVIHSGLGMWLTKNDQTVIEFAEDKEVVTLFETLTGLQYEDLDRLYDEIHGPKDYCKCGSKNIVESSGYVGETMLFCGDCGAFIWGEPVTDAMIE